MGKRIIGMVATAMFGLGCGAPPPPGTQGSPPPQTPPPQSSGAAHTKTKPREAHYGIQRGGEFNGRWCDEFVIVDSDGDLFRSLTCTGEVYSVHGWHLMRSLGTGFFAEVAGDFGAILRHPPEQPTSKCPYGAVSFNHNDGRAGGTTFGVCLDAEGNLPVPHFDQAYKRVRWAMQEPR